MTQIKAFYKFWRCTRYLCCPWSWTGGTIPLSSGWVQSRSHRGRACCRSACSASGPTPVPQKQGQTFLVGLHVTNERSTCWRLLVVTVDRVQGTRRANQKPVKLQRTSNFAQTSGIPSLRDIKQRHEKEIQNLYTATNIKQQAAAGFEEQARHKNRTTHQCHSETSL